MYKFKPILKSMLWGGDKIIPYKGIVSDAKSVGESWEISGVKENESVVAEGPDAGMLLPELIKRDGAALLGKANLERFGEEFPLLIKFIDARQDLSIQVHPNDEQAWERHQSKGKTEMWYVVDADPGSSLRSGFAKQVTPEEYEASIADNTITDLLAEYDIKAGDLFFLPAGRIHSIGAGAFIAEIQQTSNITYRIYDFNRVDANGNPRELHTEQSKAVIDTFISRGDASGTHTKELALWPEDLGITKEAESFKDYTQWYISANTGMGACLVMAEEMGAYILTDKATFLTFQANDGVI